jgi:hypothetical protein
MSSIDLDAELNKTADPDYLDPYEEQEMLEQSRKWQAFARKQSQRANSQMVTQLGYEGAKAAAEELGMTPEALYQMTAQDPQTARELYQEHAKSYWKSVGTRARDSKGRFMSVKDHGTPKRREAQSDGRPQRDRFWDPEVAEMPNREAKRQKLEELAKTSRGSDDDLDRMLSALMEGDPAFEAD